MKHIIRTADLATALLGGVNVSLAATAITGTPVSIVAGDSSADGSIGVSEKAGPGYFIYDVVNNLTGDLLALGVTAINSSSAGLVDSNGYNLGGFASGSPVGNAYPAVFYSADVLTQFDWNNSAPDIAFGDFGPGATYASIWGAWNSIVDTGSGENTINWYTALDGAVTAGASIADYFAWMGPVPASNVIGVTTGNAGNGYFTTTSIVPTVPVPAAGWLLLTGLGGLVGAAKLKRRG